MNIYGFAGNDGIGRVDVLGMAWDSANGKIAADLAIEIVKTGKKLDPSHPCCEVIKRAVKKRSPCIEFASSIIRCGYLLSGDKAMSDKIRDNKGMVDGTELSKVLAADGWKMVVYARDHRRVYSDYPTDADTAGTRYVSGEAIAGTLGQAIKKGNLYGIKVSGIAYDIAPWPGSPAIDDLWFPHIFSDANVVKTIDSEKFMLLNAANTYHVGLMAGGTFYDSPEHEVNSGGIVAWSKQYNATQIGWMMLPPDSQGMMWLYEVLRNGLKGYKPPLVVSPTP